MLHNKGIFSFDSETGMYSNNRSSKLLVSSDWRQWHRWVDLYGNEFYDMARGIPESLRVGRKRTAAQVNYDTDKTMFQYFQDKNELPKLLGTIGAGAVAQAPGMIADCCWDEVADETVLDLGGGSGAFITSLLRQFTSMKGAIFDLPKVTEYSSKNFQPGGQFEDVGNRVTVTSGDFFMEIPAFKVYSIKWCLHDWTDDQVIVILKNVRKTIIESPQSRLIIIEAVLVEGKKGKLARFGDVTMMVASGGRERDRDEWAKVAEAGGWQLKRIMPLRNVWASALELRPVV